MVQPFWKTFWQFLIKLNTHLSYDPAIILIGIYPRKIRAFKSMPRPYMDIHNSFIHSSQKLETTKKTYQLVNA